MNNSKHCNIQSVATFVNTQAGFDHLETLACVPIGFLTQLAFGFLTRLAMVGGLAACRARVDRPTGSVSGYAMIHFIH